VEKLYNIFERMQLSYSTTMEKILHVSDLSTGRADVWYYANQDRDLPNEKTKSLEWDSYGRFKNEFVEAHRDHFERWEAKQTVLKDYKRQDENMVYHISRNRAHQLIACLLRHALWEHLVNSIQPKVKTYRIQTSIAKGYIR